MSKSVSNEVKESGGHTVATPPRGIAALGQLERARASGFDVLIHGQQGCKIFERRGQQTDVTDLFLFPRSDCLTASSS